MHSVGQPLLGLVQCHLKALLRVEASQRHGGCIACAPWGQCAMRFHSDEGQCEYDMSGCCEACFDYVWGQTRVQTSECSALTEDGVRILCYWLKLRRARDELITTSEHADTLLHIAAGSVEWPVLHSP